MDMPTNGLTLLCFMRQGKQRAPKSTPVENPFSELLATGNAELTHTQDKGKWGAEFPKLLMEVRTELAKQQTQNLWSQYQQASIENNKTVDLTQAEFEALSTEEQETIIYQIKNCK